MNHNSKEKLSPIIKWAGGKEKELSVINQNLPSSFEYYYEPFVGGGSVYTSISAIKYYINDKSEELMNFYTCIKAGDKFFFNYTVEIMNLWKRVLNFSNENDYSILKYKKYRENENIDLQKLFYTYFDELEKSIMNNKQNIIIEDKLFEDIQISFFDKLKRMRKIEIEKHFLTDEDVLDNITTGLLSGVYSYFRDIYNQLGISENKSLQASLFMFIRNYCYSGMFRYNKNGDFNVPYGGMGYNNKFLDKKLEYYKRKDLLELMNKSFLYNSDFYDFFKETEPKENDFIFLDPPYDTEFSTYAKNVFDREDQKRLADFLCNECKSKWMLIIKSTPYILSLYENKGLKILEFDKQYLVSFMNRNDKNCVHLLIKNY